MTQDLTTSKIHEERQKALMETRSRLLTMPPEKALDQILTYPQPAALVHAFPEEDLYFLIHEIGPQDALPLIALASGKQLEYLLDQEIWQRDRLHIDTIGEWLERFLQSDPSPDRMIHWLTTEKLDLIEFFLLQSIEVQILEHDQDPSIFGPGFFTYDNVFYIRIIHRPSADTPDQPSEQHHDMVKNLLDRLAEADHVRFQAILMEAATVLPAEMEEEAYRRRNVRLAEKGFLPFEEAVGLYQYLNLRQFQHQAHRQMPLSDERNYHLSLVPITVLPPDSLFAQALQTMAAVHRDVMQEEFAALCNRIIVADRLKIEQREALAKVTQKACGYLHIGLQKLQDAARSSASQPFAAADSLRRYHLEGIFRLGYGAAIELKQAAEAWVPRSWFARRGLPLTFWGETWLGVIGGLLIKRPLFFDNYQTGTMYREFASREDINNSQHQLEQVQHFDRLLERLDPVFASPRFRFLSYKNLLLTLWARHRLALPEDLQHLTTQAFKPFFRELFQTMADPAGKKRRKISDALRSDFLHWLADRTEQTATELSVAIGPSLEALFVELEESYGRVNADHIDPRYIHHFLLEPHEA